MHHVHFGAGRFGLGFVGWLSKHLRLNLHLANRGDASGRLSDRNSLIANSATYDIKYVTGAREAVTVANCLNFGNESDREHLVRLIALEETKLLTASLARKSEDETKQAYGKIAPIILEGLIARQRGERSKLYVLACANVRSWGESSVCGPLKSSISYQGFRPRLVGNCCRHRTSPSTQSRCRSNP